MSTVVVSFVVLCYMARRQRKVHAFHRHCMYMIWYDVTFEFLSSYVNQGWRNVLNKNGERVSVCGAQNDTVDTLVTRHIFGSFVVLCCDSTTDTTRGEHKERVPLLEVVFPHIYDPGVWMLLVRNGERAGLSCSQRYHQKPIFSQINPFLTCSMIYMKTGTYI